MPESTIALDVDFGGGLIGRSGRLTSRPALLAAVVGGSVAAAVSLVLPALGIIAGAVAGVAAALAVSRHG